MIIYSEKVIEHFMCPQNAHSMPDADAEGSYGDPSCGDCLTVYIKVKNNCIEEISYLVFGCCASIATSSMTSILAKGKTLRQFFHSLSPGDKSIYRQGIFAPFWALE